VIYQQQATIATVKNIPNKTIFNFIKNNYLFNADDNIDYKTGETNIDA
jgi:hypothetical protein